MACTNLINQWFAVVSKTVSTTFLASGLGSERIAFTIEYNREGQLSQLAPWLNVFGPKLDHMCFTFPSQWERMSHLVC